MDEASFIVACDTGGTFTDLVVWSDGERLGVYKAHTDPADPPSGIIDALGQAAAAHGLTLEQFLGATTALIHGTTHSINAIITSRTARTAFLTSAGHPDILLLREGGRDDPFDAHSPFPEPYVPRALTFEIPGRIGADGAEVIPLDESAVRATAAELKGRGVEAVGVCLLWSIVNGRHELAVEAILAEVLPGVPVTLSHQLNPSIREYRRALSTCIDASLRPLMEGYLKSLEQRLRSNGFSGELSLLTAQGGISAAQDVAHAPILTLNSGPAMAPIAGNFIAGSPDGTVIVADTGGTTYDISIVRGGAIPRTRETRIGDPRCGLITGFPSIEIKSIGAGGGSIAWIDAGGLLHVGPHSAGSTPGPAAYGRGGRHPTFTDACLVLGYIDPAYFLGGRDQLDRNAAAAAIERDVAGPLGCSVGEAALAILEVVTENMAQAIIEMALEQGVDPSKALLIGGGGAAGLNSVFIAQRLGCRQLLVPELGPALSAAGALIGDLSWEFREVGVLATDAFDETRANAIITALRKRAQGVLAGRDGATHDISFSVEARYARQAWDIEVALPLERFAGAADLDTLCEAFHAEHERLFTYRDERSPIEIINWTVRVRCRPGGRPTALRLRERIDRTQTFRAILLPDVGQVDAPVLSLAGVPKDRTVPGPILVETPFTSIVVAAGWSARRTANGDLMLEREVQ